MREAGKSSSTGHTQPTANLRLRRARDLRGWSQQRVAEAIGTSNVMVSRWESGLVMPGPHFRAQLCELFGQTAEDLGFLPATTSSPLEQPPENHAGQPPAYPYRAELSVAEAVSPSQLWQMPLQRNPCFTGRDAILTRLHTALHSRRKPPLPQALCGLGGVGKTQTALDYAYRYAEEYHAVLWVKADTRDTLHSSFVSLAQLLDVPVAHYQHDPAQLVEAVKRRLAAQTDWLLVLDNVEDLDLVREFLPTHHHGHVILTTRLHAIGTLAQRITVESLNPEDGALLLLRRAQLVAPDADLTSATADQHARATALSALLGGLPLALDQAGAYIEETQCSLQAYQNLFTHHPSRLLAWRSTADRTYPYSVSTSLALSLTHVAQAHPAAAELLQLCVFLHPDAVPVELIVQGADHLGSILGSVAASPLALNEIFVVLGRFSLICRHPETEAVSLHRLLQMVLRDCMEEAKQQLWAQRAVQIVNQVLPEAELYDHWLRFHAYVPHARACSAAIHDLNLMSVEAGRLLSVMGLFLREGGQFGEAEVFQRRSQQCLIQAVGSTHPAIAFSLDELATVYTYQANYEQAEPLYQQALAVFRHCLEPTDEKIVRTLGNLGVLAFAQSQYAQATAYHQQALELQEQAGRSDEALTATLYGDQAMNYNAMGEYAQAELLFQRALHLYERRLAPEHPLVTSHLHNLACCYYAQGKYGLAETVFRQSLLYRQQTLGDTHPLVADNLNSLGVLYEKLGHYRQAEAYHRQALAIRESVHGPYHPWVAISTANLARVFLEQRQLTEAERLFERALAIYQQKFGMKHVRTIQCLAQLGRVHTLQNHATRAESLLRQALTLQEEVCGPNHPYTAIILVSLASLLSKLRRFAEAKPLYHQAIRLQKRTLGQMHPDLAESLYFLACCYILQGKAVAAQFPYQRAMHIWEHTLGLAHLQVQRYSEEYAQAASEHERASESECEPVQISSEL
jgi:tetratricopeptide (TPR) repeat protein/transcriptional regulator with XRE-family HTH domain